MERSVQMRMLGLLAAVIGAAGCCATAGTVPVTLHPQEMSNWCWAASGQMIMEALKHPHNQCEQVNDAYSLHCACIGCPGSASGDPNCNKSGWPQFCRYGFANNETASGQALNYSQIKDQVSAKHAAFAFTQFDEGGSGHTQVVRGFREVDGQQLVSIIDPESQAVCTGAEADISWTDFVGTNGRHHWKDHYDIKFANVTCPPSAPAQPLPPPPPPPNLLGSPASPSSSPGPTDRELKLASPRLAQRDSAPPVFTPYVPKEVAAKDLAGPALAAAQSGLKTLSKLATPDHYQSLGFAEPNEAQQAATTLGLPLRDTFVRLDQLTSFQSGGNPDALFIVSQRVLYPVLAGTQVRSSIEVTRTNGVWRVSSYGAPGRIRAFAQYRQRVSQSTGVAADAFFVVRIPALRISFLAYPTSSGTKLVPIAADPRFGLEPGQPVDASQALSKMVPVAATTPANLPG